MFEAQTEWISPESFPDLKKAIHFIEMIMERDYSDV